jgi:membrane-bound acyltransferase YfiQ involved in biofilm formation
VTKEDRSFAGKIVAALFVAALAFGLYHAHNATAAALVQFIVQKLADVIAVWPYIVASLVVGFCVAAWGGWSLRRKE